MLTVSIGQADDILRRMHSRIMEAKLIALDEKCKIMNAIATQEPANEKEQETLNKIQDILAEIE